MELGEAVELLVLVKVLEAILVGRLQGRVKIQPRPHVLALRVLPWLSYDHAGEEKT